LHKFNHVSLGRPQMYCVALEVHQRFSVVKRQLVGYELSKDVIESLLAGAINKKHCLVVNHVEQLMNNLWKYLAEHVFV